MALAAGPNERIVRMLYDAFNARDIPGVAALIADECETVDVPSGRSYRGFAGFMEWVKPFADAMPDSTATPTHCVENGAWLATEHIGRGTQTGTFVTPMGEIPPCGRSVEIRFGEFFRLRDGKIVELRAYYDTGSVLRQIT
jgi:steroid delta-isomerase-like uncharacterized protein